MTLYELKVVQSPGTMRWYSSLVRYSPVRYSPVQFIGTMRYNWDIVTLI